MKVFCRLFLFNMWGSMLMPTAYRSNPAQFFVDSNITNPAPIISFHGDLDNVFDVDSESVYFDPSGRPQYNSESHCLLFNQTFTLEGLDYTADLLQFGSAFIYNWLQAAHIPTMLYTDCQMHHGLDNDPETPYLSDFGTSLSNSTEVGHYMVQRASIFFQGVLNNLISSFSNTKYIECEDRRYISKSGNQCLINNNNGCNDGFNCASTP